MKQKMIMLAIALAAGCSDSTSVVEDIEGRYALVMHGSKPVPTMSVCGGFEVRSGEVILETFRRALYRLRYVEPGTNREINYDAEGWYLVSDSTVTITVRGRWSNAESELYTNRYFFELTPDGALMRRHVGAECDASDIETYRRR